MSYRRKETIGDATLYLGDCLEILPTLPKVDAVVTDPPYFLPATHYATRKQFARSLSDVSILDFYFRHVFAALHEITPARCCYYIFCDGQSYPFFYVAMYPNVRRIVPLVWDKKTSVNGYHWRHQHELIIFAEGFELEPVPTGDGDVLSFRAAPVETRTHGAEKPVELLEKLVAKIPDEMPLVIDPFMGSGTTGVACANLGRKFIGIEIEERYFDIACERIAAAYAQGRLFK